MGFVSVWWLTAEALALLIAHASGSGGSTPHADRPSTRQML
jgi:hypothetical protein